MIQLRLNSADLQHMRFAYSPLLEAAESLYMVHSGRISEPHRGWFEISKEAIRRYDTEVLRAALPARGKLANVFLMGATDAETSMDDQLHRVACYPPERLGPDLAEVWLGTRTPPAVTELAARGAAGAQQLAEDLGRYWAAAIKPHWAQIRAVLDGDVAHRASRIAHGSIATMMSGLHPGLTVSEDGVTVRAPAHREHDLSGEGLLLIPSVFAWPWIIIDPGHNGPASLIYGARGVGTLWESHPAPADDDALAGLLGRTRAAILDSLALPQSTTDLARQLGQSAPTVSAHLSVLRRCGMVISWPSGRRVLYQRTPLATSLMIASSGAPGLRNTGAGTG